MLVIDFEGLIMLILGTILVSKVSPVVVRHVNIWNRPENRGVRFRLARQYVQLRPEQSHTSLIEVLWHKH